jgi:hypothetical protein
MSAKKGFLWTLHVLVALIFQFRAVVIWAWAIFGLALCLPDHWELWPVGFVVLMALEAAAYMLLNGGPLDPRRLSPGGNFSN